MKKIFIIGFVSVLLVVMLSSSIKTFAAEQQKEKQQNEFYWANTTVSNSLQIAGNPKESVSLSPKNQELTSPLTLFTEKIKEQLTNILLQFDSLADSFSNKSKQLSVDTIDIQVSMSAEGKLFIGSGKTEGSVTIRLKNKNRNNP